MEFADVKSAKFSSQLAIKNVTSTFLVIGVGILLVRIVLMISCVKPTFLKVWSFISAISAVTWLVLNASNKINDSVLNATIATKINVNGLVEIPVKVKTSAPSSKTIHMTIGTTKSTGIVISAKSLMKKWATECVKIESNSVYANNFRPIFLNSNNLIS